MRQNLDGSDVVAGDVPDLLRHRVTRLPPITITVVDNNQLVAYALWSETTDEEESSECDLF